MGQLYQQIFQLCLLAASCQVELYALNRQAALLFKLQALYVNVQRVVCKRAQVYVGTQIAHVKMLGIEQALRLGLVHFIERKT